MDDFEIKKRLNNPERFTLKIYIYVSMIAHIKTSELFLYNIQIKKYIVM